MPVCIIFINDFVIVYEYIVFTASIVRWVNVDKVNFAFVRVVQNW